MESLAHFRVSKWPTDSGPLCRCLIGPSLRIGNGTRRRLVNWAIVERSTAAPGTGRAYYNGNPYVGKLGQ